MPNNNELREVDVATVYDKGSVAKFEQITPKDLLSFAKSILFYLFVLVIFVFSLSYAMARFAADNSPLMGVVTTILDITKTAVPSIVTLVLGFYFGKRDAPPEGGLNSGS